MKENKSYLSFWVCLISRHRISRTIHCWEAGQPKAFSETQMKEQRDFHVLVQRWTWKGLGWGSGLGLQGVIVSVPRSMTFPQEETRIISPKSPSTQSGMHLRCPVFPLCNIVWSTSCWFHPIVWWLRPPLLTIVYKMLYFLINLLVQNLLTPAFLSSLLLLIPCFSLRNLSLKNDLLV